MLFSFLTNIFKDPKATDQDINLLLLGETGVGKSTLINSISNYFNYPDFKKAQKETIDVLIPVCLNLSNGSKVYGNPDENENHESGKSATQQVKVYLFPIKMGRKSFNLRLVDTPGVGDPRGLDQDNTNLDNILSYLATLKKLHGICFVLKSNQTRFTKFVEYCLKQILTRLDKSASENIIFITTYSKSAQYTAGETKAHCLEPLVRDIKSKPPHVSIPLSDKNIFAVDNEAFKALLEIQEGKQFSKHELKGLGKSWQISSEAIRRLLKYITGDFRKPALKPHEVENTISVNEVRFLIEQLATPIAEVSELIQDNLRLLDRHKKSLNLENQTVEQLKEQLHIPCVDLSVKELSQPVTVCTDAKCTDIVKVNDVTQWHYRQRCHNPCYLSGIPKEMIGDPGLINCAAMSGENCARCGCHWKVHMHIYKETEKIEVQKDDQNVKDAIKTKDDARVHIENLMKNLNKRMKELEDESETISKIIAKFSYFLQEHALTPFNDAYSDYIKQLIKNERHLGKYSDQEVIAKLEKLLSQHEHLQKTFHESAKKFHPGSGGSDLTPQGIKNSITELYNLKHMGKTIQELIKTSSACRQKETQKNFSCIVSQQIDLNQKVVEEERYQKVDYSEYDDTDAIYDGTEFYGSEYSYQTIMQRRQNKTPASEYALDGPTDDYHSIYEPEYGVTYESRTNDSDDRWSMRSSSSRQYSRHRFYDDDVSVRSAPRNRQRSNDQRRYAEDLYGKKGTQSSKSRTSRHNHTPDSTHQSRSSADRRSREHMYEESSRRNNSHRNQHELSRTSSRSSYDWNNSKYSRDSDNRKPVKLHRNESRAKYETRNHHTREPKHDKEQVSDDRRHHHHHHHHENDNRSVRSSRSVPKHDSSRRSRGSEEYHDRESERKSRSKGHDELEDSSRNHRHRRDSYDSDDHHPRRSSRSDHVSKGKSSKYEKKFEVHRYDSDSDRSNSSFESAHTGRDNYRRKQRNSERGNDSGDSDNKHSMRSSKNAYGTKHVDSKNRRKSKPNDKKYESDDQHSTRSSRREEPQSERRKKHDQSDDSDDKHSRRSSRSGYSIRNNKPKNQKVSKSSLTKKSESTKKNYASDDNSSDKSEKSSKRHSNASSYSSETCTLNKKSEGSQSDEDVENEE